MAGPIILIRDYGLRLGNGEVIMTMMNNEMKDRERLGFAEAVAQYIGPILSTKGFLCSEATPYAVKFLTSYLTLVVFHDRLSFEIDVIFARRGVASERYNLQNML